MVGKHLGFLHVLAKDVPIAEFNCSLHQEALCAKASLISVKNVVCCNKNR
jgi:hypothetical protein